MIRSLIFCAFIFLVGQRATAQHLVLVSKDPSGSYTTWIQSLDSTLAVRDFYNIPTDSMNYFLSKSSGIIMTGGEDVNPDLYGKPEYKDLCELPDNFRDSIEEVMIRFALNQNRPMIGICRGQQIINAVNGGTLIPDIPTSNPTSTVSHRSKLDSAHTVTPNENSWMSGSDPHAVYWVNSRHHQSVDRVASGFKIAATSSDGIIESIELKDNETHSFIICVQWHPESLRDSLSTVLGSRFLNEL